MTAFIPYGRQSITAQDIQEVSKALTSDWITGGPTIEVFETALCHYLSCSYAAAVCNGTAALDLAVQALNLPAGSEIITTPFTFMATSNAILYNGHKPVFADIKKDTFNIDPEQVRKKITPRTKAIIYVDYAGQPCDIDELKEIAKEHKLYLIEDAAHALGAEYQGKKVGSHADLTTFSFHPVKHITTGEGGAVTTNDKALYEKVKVLRNHGMDKEAKDRFGPGAGWQYDMKMLGRNYRITDFQCALGLSQLKKIEDFLQRRTEIARRYQEAFKDNPKLKIQATMQATRHAWHLYPILLDPAIDRDKAFNQLREAQIGVNVHYIPIYKFTFYQQFGINANDYPNTEDVFNRILSLPMYPDLSEAEQDRVIAEINKLTA